jgi:hypothetical protein
MELYPKQADPRVASKWGNQKFGKVMDGRVETAVDYVPVPLDSQANAVERMLVAMDEGKRKGAVVAAGLNGSDEAGTVTDLLKEIEAEVKAMAAVDPATCKDEADYRAKLSDRPVSRLDVDTWISRKAITLGGVMPYGVSVVAEEL